MNDKTTGYTDHLNTIRATFGRGLRHPRGETRTFADVRELATAIQQHEGPEAWWSAGVFADGYRSRPNWRGSHCIGIDLDCKDGGRKRLLGPGELLKIVESARDEGAAFVYDTPHGARLVWTVDEPIEDAALLASITQGLGERLAGKLRAIPGLTWDRATKDAARLWFTPRASFEGQTRGGTVVVTGGVSKLGSLPRAVVPDTRTSADELPSLELVQSALTHLDASSYEGWVEAGMALKAYGEEGFEVWDAWSATAPEKYEPEAMSAKWASFSAEGVGPATILHRANETCPGWQGAHLAKAFEKVEKAARQRPWSITPYAEALNAPTAPWGIKGFARTGQVGFLAAAPAVGKSTLAVAWAVAAAWAVDWCGQRVRAGHVLALVGEDRQGFVKRIRAAAKERGLPETPEHRLDIVSFNLALSTPQGQRALRELIDEWVAEHGVPALILIDTLSSHWAETEDSSEFAAPFMRVLEEIARLTRAVVAVMHHVVKARGRTTMPELGDMRGSGAFGGSSDFVVGLCQGQAQGEVLVEGVKNKTDPVSPRWRMSLKKVPLGVDEDGEDVTAGVLGQDWTLVTDAEKREQDEHPVDRILRTLVEADRPVAKTWLIENTPGKDTTNRATLDQMLADAELVVATTAKQGRSRAMMVEITPAGRDRASGAGFSPEVPMAPEVRNIEDLL